MVLRVNFQNNPGHRVTFGGSQAHCSEERGEEQEDCPFPSPSI